MRGLLETLPPGPARTLELFVGWHQFVGLSPDHRGGLATCAPRGAQHLFHVLDLEPLAVRVAAQDVFPDGFGRRWRRSEVLRCQGQTRNYFAFVVCVDVFRHYDTSSALRSRVSDGPVTPENRTRSRSHGRLYTSGLAPRPR
jgi:hypothetical protein